MKNVFLLFVSFLLMSCGDNHLSLDRSKASSNGNNAAGTDGAVTFLRDIQPIFKKSCSACHNEGSAVPNWNNYAVSFAKKDRLFDRVVVKKDMPLGMPMSDDERALVATWIKTGAPEGIAEAPRPPAQVVKPEPPVTPAEPAPTQPEDEVLRYAKVKTAVFDQYCSLCHNENTGDMMPNWGSYEIVQSKKDRIYNRVVVQKTMPPEGMPFSEEAREMLKRWIDNGAVE